jgi:hypothetical protein
MSVFQRLGVLAAGVAGGALVALAAGALPAAEASATASVKVPNGCKTFTIKSADALFGVRKGTRLTEKATHTGKGSNELWTCTVTHGGKTGKKLTVFTSALAGGFGGPIKCYKRPKLGKGGEVCVSTMKKFPFTFAVFHKDKIYFSDNFNRTLPHQGQGLYAFALAQYKAFKG